MRSRKDAKAQRVWLVLFLSRIKNDLELFVYCEMH